MTAAPRLVVAVANQITGDSRVQKSALAAARDGWEVILLGVTKGSRVQRSMMGPIQVIRVPVIAGARVSRDHRFLRRITGFRLRDKAAVRRYHDKFHRRNAYGKALLNWLRRKPKPLQLAGLPITTLMRMHRLGYRARMRAYNWGEQPSSTVTGDWRVDHPYLVDLITSIGPHLEELKPDVVHANDITMLGVVAQAVANMRAKGETVGWFYDAHEYVRAIQWPTPRTHSAFPALEEEFIRQADAVSTVSPELAELLAGHYRLDKLPVVVQNAPVREIPATAGPKPSVRAACGLADSVDLLVYSGWISADRGLSIVVEALPKLPACHFAIVTGRSTPILDDLLRRATELGVRDRIHVVPYVAQHLVPEYLSSADLGTICFRRSPAYENSLPTKMAEYIHAGLPVIVNDLKAVTDHVRRHDIGEVFTDEPDDFADAVVRALGRREQLAANIAEPILRELSWEHQSEALLQLYRDLSTRVPEAGRLEIPWDLQESPLAELPQSSVPLTKWRPLSNTDVRLGLGPANYAGQLAGFAQAICRANPHVSAEVIMRVVDEKIIMFPADIYLDGPRLHGMSLQIEQSKRIIGRYTHLIADAFLPIFGSLNGNSIEDDLPLLHLAGIKVALLGHGSEIRHPGRHMSRHANSFFREAPDGIVETYSKRAERNRQIAENSGLPLFITTPDLIHDLPNARWAPLVVDVDAWSSTHPVMERNRPVVLHAPSKRWTKSTGEILGPLTRLDACGAIELQLVEAVSRSEMQKLVQEADIVLDQFGSGSYGTFAVEAMAAGRPVLAYIDENISDLTGVQPPIVNATPDTLREALEHLLDDRGNAARIGAQSAAYARDNHDGRRTALVFADFLAL